MLKKNVEMGRKCNWKSSLMQKAITDPFNQARTKPSSGRCNMDGFEPHSSTKAFNSATFRESILVSQVHHNALKRETYKPQFSYVTS